MDEFLSLGGSRQDLKTDISKRYISILDAHGQPIPLPAESAPPRPVATASGGGGAKGGVNGAAVPGMPNFGLTAALGQTVITSSRFRGVHWDKVCRKWRAQIYHEGKMKNLGAYGSEDEAAKVYDTRARELKGARAKPNFDLAG